jgi:predicted dinucleotide-binding enzyme
MKIAIIGTGGIGRGLATLFVRHAHTVILGTRNPDRPNELARDLSLQAVSYAEAADAAELVCFCIGWEHAEGAIAMLGDLSGKVLLDPSNPETLPTAAVSPSVTPSRARRFWPPDFPGPRW